MLTPAPCSSAFSKTAASGAKEKAQDRSFLVLFHHMPEPCSVSTRREPWRHIQQEGLELAGVGCSFRTTECLQRMRYQVPRDNPCFPRGCNLTVLIPLYVCMDGWMMDGWIDRQRHTKTKTKKLDSKVSFLVIYPQSFSLTCSIMAVPLRRFISFL